MANNKPNLLSDEQWWAEHTTRGTIQQQLLAARQDERSKCANACDDVAEECNSWDEDGEAGKVAAMQCAARIREA